MAWTTDDLDAIDVVIREYMSTGVESYSINGRSITYKNLDDLLKLRAIIQSEINAATNGRTYASFRYTGR